MKSYVLTFILNFDYFFINITFWTYKLALYHFLCFLWLFLSIFVANECTGWKHFGQKPLFDVNWRQFWCKMIIKVQFCQFFEISLAIVAIIPLFYGFYGGFYRCLWSTSAKDNNILVKRIYLMFIDVNCNVKWLKKSNFVNFRNIDGHSITFLGFLW